MLELLDEMAELIYVVDPDTYELLYMNRAGKKEFGIEDVKGLKCYRTIQGLDGPCKYCTNSYLKEHAFYTWEHDNPVSGRHYLLKDTLIDWGGRRAKIEIAFDMTEQERERASLEALSYRDSLTGALNRNAFIRDIKRFREGPPGPAGVVYVDINGMKQLNDQRGHEQGDLALVNLVRRIQETFQGRPCYRMGGDEFVILCRGACEEAFDESVRLFRRNLSGEASFTISIGTGWNSSCEDLQVLVSLADEQMYSDKKKFYRGEALTGRYRHQIDDVLGMADPNVLQNLIDHGFLVVFYQPKIPIRGQGYIGAEALIRCRLASGGYLLPDKFIPVLEQARLIGVLDFHVFESVCGQLQRWREQGMAVGPVSVNFSRFSLDTDSFADRIEEIRQRYQVPVNQLELEITETAESEDSQAFLTIVRQLRERGFHVSIDDFGVKNANLSMFTSIDFDILKIDKSLVDGLVDNQKAQTIIGAISEICHRVRIKLVAEGVENKKQFALLKELGCDEVQGYLFSRPLSRDSYERGYLRLNKHRKDNPESCA